MVEKNKKKKEKSPDLIGIALLHLAQKNYKVADDYGQALRHHFVKFYKFDEDGVDNWLWEFIVEGGDFDSLVEHIKEDV